MVRQEGLAAYFSGLQAAALPQDSTELMQNHLQTAHYPTIIACLYGDEVASACGYDTLGLPPDAGLRFGLTLARLAKPRA